MAWIVDAGRVSGRRVRRQFPTEAAARAFADTLTREARKIGQAAAGLSPHDRIDAARARALLPAGVGIMEAVSFYLAHAPARTEAPAFALTVADYLAEKQTVGLRPHTLADARARCGMLAVAFGGRSVAAVSAADLSALLSRFGPVNAGNYRRHAAAFFAWCVRRGYRPDNPALSVPAPKTEAKPPGIFTPREAAALLNAAAGMYARLVPPLAFGFFAGLRPAEVLALDWSSVHYGVRLVRVEAATAKTRRTRLVDILPALEAWTRPHAKTAGRVGVPLCVARRHLTGILKAAGVACWPFNGLRHSFASYHLAAFEDAGKTALQLGHTGGLGVLYAHYRAIVTREDAARFWSIRPGCSTVQMDS